MPMVLPRDGTRAIWSLSTRPTTNSRPLPAGSRRRTLASTSPVTSTRWSSVSVPNATASLRDLAIDIVWRQWRAIGGAASGQSVTRQVDPEALILASLTFDYDEPRLWTVMLDWLRASAR